MWKNEAKNNLQLLIKAGIPFTLLGMIIVFSGLYLIKHIFKDNEYIVLFLFAWLAIFWAVYQPLFRKQITKVKKNIQK